MKIIKKTVNRNLINISLLSLILVIHSISLFTIDIVIKQIRSKRNNLDEKKKKDKYIFMVFFKYCNPFFITTTNINK